MSKEADVIYSGTAEELVNDDVLMTELNRLDNERLDLEDSSVPELLVMLKAAQAEVDVATKEVSAIIMVLAKKAGF